MSDKWRCPKCGAPAGEHGIGGSAACRTDRGQSQCSGLICECPEEGSEEHGETDEEPCPEANCYHCGWVGVMPPKEKKRKRAEDPLKLLKEVLPCLEPLPSSTLPDGLLDRIRKRIQQG